MTSLGQPFVLTSFLLQPWNAVDFSAEPDSQSSWPNASELVRSTRSAAVVHPAKRSVAEVLASMHSSLKVSRISPDHASGSREKTRNETTSTTAGQSPVRLSAAPGGGPAKDSSYYRHLLEQWHRHTQDSKKFFKVCRVEDESSSGGGGGCRLVFPDPISIPVVLENLRKMEQGAKVLRRKLMAERPPSHVPTPTADDDGVRLIGIACLMR